MPEISFVTHIAQTLYGLELQSIESLAQYHFDWRGIYRLHDAHNRIWVLRMMQLPDVFESFTHTARLLQWLARSSYQAPIVHVTRDGQLVGSIDGWTTLVLSYVDGTLIGMHSADLGLLAHTIGHLHTLRNDLPHGFAQSRCHPDNIATTINRLAHNREKVPHAFQSFLHELYESMTALQQCVGHSLYITHGDCWYMNAVKTNDSSVILIDWDNAGLGLPLLDLGNLLITSHFDLRQPLQIEANEFIIRAIMDGYQRERPVTRQQAQSLGDAMRFLLAFQLGSYVTEDEFYLKPDFPFILQKLQVRSNATHDILAIALDYLD